MGELKPCPFCGRPIYGGKVNEPENGWVKHTKWCFFTTLDWQFLPLDKLNIKAWNRRAGERKEGEDETFSKR